MNKKFISVIMAAILAVSVAAVGADAAEVEVETSKGQTGTFFFDTGNWNSAKLQFYIWDDTAGTKATKDGWTTDNPWGSNKKLGGTLREDLSGKDGNEGNVFESYEVELEPDHVYFVIFNDPDHGQTFNCCLSVDALGDTAARTGNMMENPEDSEKTAEEAKFRGCGLGAQLCLTSSGKLQGYSIPVGTNKPNKVSTFVLRYLGTKEKLSGAEVVTTDILDQAYSAFDVTADEVWEDYKKFPTEEGYKESWEKYGSNYNEKGAKEMIRPTASEEEKKDSDSDSDTNSNNSNNNSNNNSGSNGTSSRSSSTSSTSSASGNTSTGGNVAGDAAATSTGDTTGTSAFAGILVAAAATMLVTRKKIKD